MRRFLLGAAMAAILTGTTAQPVLSQGNPFQAVVYVNDSAVTRFEVDQRARFLRLLRAPDTDLASVEKSLIDDRLRVFAGKQMDIRATPEQIDAGLTEFASRGGMSTEQFVSMLASSGVEEQTFRDFVASGVVWRDVVRRRVVPMVNIDPSEVDQAMTRVIETPEITHVALSEVIIPAPEGQERAAMARAEAIIANTKSEAAFAAAAREYSATPSAENGGRLPWAPLANLPPALRPMILAMQPGQVSQALTVPGAVVLFYLRDTRGTLRPGAKDQVLDYAVAPFASEAEAARILSVSDTCNDLYAPMRGLPEAQLQQQTLPQSAIPTDIALRLATLDDNEGVIVNRGGSVQVIMLCKRSSALLADASAAPVPTTAEAGADGQAPAANALPNFEAMREQVFNNRVQQAADAYLAELRADAIIRRP